MVFAALVLLVPVPQNARASTVHFSTKTEVAALSGEKEPDTTRDKNSADGTGKSSDGAKDSSLVANAAGPTAALPSMPVAKATAEPPAAGAAFPVSPVRPAIAAIHETPSQRKAWYALAIAGHTGAAFDAWSTRRALSAGVGTESNPMLRPFAHSNALYAATQVSPLVMDFLGKKMMTSQHKWVRKLWWVPQTAGASVSFAAGAHNVGLVQ
jgi:hypothetical protein